MCPAAGKTRLPWSQHLLSTLSGRIYCSILVQKMCVLGPTPLSEILDLHDLGQRGHVDSRFRSLSKVVLFENVGVLDNSKRQTYQI